MKEQIEEMRDFMLKKSNSANVEPVFTTSEGQEIVLGKDLTKLLNDVLEQAFIPFLAEALYNAGFSKQEWISVEDRMPPALGKVLVYSPILGVYMTCYTAYSPRFAEESVTHWMPLPEPPEMKGGAE